MSCLYYNDFYRWKYDLILSIYTEYEDILLKFSPF